jgi:hypothetical protein
VAAGHVSVRDPNHLKSRALKDGSARHVVAPPLIRVMRVTIQLQYDPRLQTTKIHDEAVNYVLPAKLDAKHTAISQERPRESLRRCGASAQFARQCEFLSSRDSS